MCKKRGILLLVVLVVTIMCSVIVLSEGEVRNPLVKYRAVQMQVNCDSGDECRDQSHNLDEYCTNVDDCLDDEIDSFDFPHNNGCHFYVIETDDYADDEAARIVLPFGINIDENYRTAGKYTSEFSDLWDNSELGRFNSKLFYDSDEGKGLIARSWQGWESGEGVVNNIPVLEWVGGSHVAVFYGTYASIESVIDATGNLLGLWGDEDAEAALRYSKFRYKEGAGVICLADSYWHQCDKNHIDSVVYVYSLAYRCTELADNKGYVWREVGEDLDFDGYLPQQGDCASSPLSYAFSNEMPTDCPSLESDELIAGLHEEELRELVRSRCEYPRHSLCPSCINSDAPETCGDRANNDCIGGRGSLETLDDNTPDDCNLNKFACEQKILPANDEKPEEIPKTFYNTNNQLYSWIETREGGQCCGFGGIKDLGKPEKAVSSAAGNHICLNKDAQLVSVQEGDPSQIDWGLCQGDWCWVSAEGNAKSNIYTVKKAGEDNFDVVSDGKNWLACQEGVSDIATGTLNDLGLIKQANRFHCYKEGDRWVWADCLQSEEAAAPDNGIKKRDAGDGLFKLTPQSSSGNSILIDLNSYDNFYGSSSLDLVGYDQLEFIVGFTSEEIKLPAEIMLRIYGPPGEDSQNVPYMEENVLTHAVNNPLLESRKSIHIIVPISDMVDVEKIRIDSVPTDNIFTISNIYVSKERETPLICSGKLSTQEDKSSWLQDVDFFESLNRNSEHICKARYGENSWFGEKVENPARRCCGNQKGEYYAGESENNYGCWNSEAISSGQTVMNVQFEVEHRKETFNIDYQPIQFKINSVEVSLGYNILEGGRQPTDIVVGKLSDIPTEFDKVYYVEQLGGRIEFVKNIETETFPDISIDLKTSPAKVGEVSLKKNRFLNRFNDEPYGEVTLSVTGVDGATIENIHAYFIDPLNPGTILDKVTYNNMPFADTNFYLMAELAENKPDIEKSNSIVSSRVNYPCSKAECVYPLPGKPPYKITNLYPHLYELYFVNDEGEELFIGEDTSFDVKGNVKATKIAQQVIYANTQDPFDIGFYGCKAANFLEESLTNLNYCQIKTDKFCAYSSSGSEGVTTVNSWSADPISRVGYQIPEDVENLVETDLQLKELSAEELIPASSRNHSATSLPGRNFVPNAEFITDGQSLPRWDIINAENILLQNELTKIEEELPNKVVLQDKEILKSERIAVPQDTRLFFSANTSDRCDVEIALTGFDGQITTAESGEPFDTMSSSFVEIKFTGPCQVEQPSLQLVDDLGINNYNYKSQHSALQDFDARAGASCCPANYCWNGYSCVEPMGSSTNLAENVGEERFYRCIDGQWQNLPVKYDWNAQEWGFCSLPQQCFVLSSSNPAADASRTAADFRQNQGSLPVCIDDNEYIFDHLCESGNWSSRTKYLANPLIEITGGDDYVLYCANLRTALPELNNKEIYFGIENIASLAGGESSDNESNLFAFAQQKDVSNCFNLPESLYGEKSLFREGENTCINNVCVLKYKDGDDSKTAFATTLNKPIDDLNSFLLAMDIGQNPCTDNKGENWEFSRCNNLPIKGEMMYSPELGAIIYAKDGVPSSGLFKRMWKTILGWFGATKEVLPEDTKFISTAQNFRDIYLLRSGEKSVRAVKEVSDQEEKLTAEYENFETSLCDFFDINKIELPPNVRRELIQVAAGQDVVSCNRNDSMQKVEASAGLDFFWPQLTGRLRVG